MVALMEDIYLRDFTINGASYRIADGMLFTHEHSLTDLRERRLRMTSSRAFSDDPTRMWRAVQFTSRFGLNVDGETEAEIRAQAWRISGEAPERIGEELCKLLGRSPTVEPGFELARRTGLLERSLPAVARAYGVEQNEFHAYDVYGHTIAAVEAAGPNMVDRLAALCHDLGKPETRREGGPHGATFYGHEEVGADITRDMLSELKMPTALINATSTLVREHMYATAPTLSDAAVRRFIKRVGPELIERQFTLRHADVVGCGFERPESIEINAVFEERVRRALALAPALTPKDLAIDGREIVAALIAGGVRAPGYRGGKAVGDILGRLVDDVIEDPALNTSDRLRERAATAIESMRVDRELRVQGVSL
jgi:tRNA nucleotidyltransferase (CCA-adding enzyme)